MHAALLVTLTSAAAYTARFQADAGHAIACSDMDLCFPCRSDSYNDKATAKLLGAALGADTSDIEMANTGIAAAFAPSWVQRSEKIKMAMALLKERITKLKE